MEKGIVNPFADPDSDDEDLSVAGENGAPRRRGGFCGFGKKKLTEREKRKIEKIRERRMVDERGVRMFSPMYNGLAAALSACKSVGACNSSVCSSPFHSTDFVAAGVNVLVKEWVLDGSFIRFAFAAWSPLLFCVSLVCQHIVVGAL